MRESIWWTLTRDLCLLCLSWEYSHQWAQAVLPTSGQQIYYIRVPREPTVAHQDEGDSWKNQVPSSGQVYRKAGPAAEKKPGVPQEGHGDIL